jgi:TPR repeat protein
MAQKGDPRAQYELSRRCTEQRNYRCALVWLRKSVAQGHPAAQNRLGVMYERGEGVRTDEVEALKCYTLAESGNAYARANRMSLERRLTPDQIAAARARLPVDSVASLAKSSDIE